MSNLSHDQVLVMNHLLRAVILLSEPELYVMAFNTHVV